MLTTESLAALERLTGQIFAQLEAVPTEALGWQPPLPDTNSLYVLAYHTVAAGEWLTMHLVCGQPYERDRPAEFRARGADLAALRARYDRWLAATRDGLARLTDVDLAAMRQYQTTAGRMERSVGGILLHAVAHTATHLGHMELTRQLWEAQAKGA